MGKPMPKKPTKQAAKGRARPHVDHDAPVFTVAEAAARLRIGRSSLYEAMAGKRLRYLKYGTRRLIARDDLDAFIASLRT